MLTHLHSIRVRFNEVDSMGIVYHGNYPPYLEEARTEMLRSLGISYVQIEQNGIMMPVIEMNFKYIAPARYDDVLTISTTLLEVPQGARVTFHYQILSSEQKLLNEAFVVLAFMDSKTRRPCRIPLMLQEKIAAAFDQKENVVDVHG
ncbi:MAG: acyl-CoA thioesterase [Bacteroidales bacterium]